MKMKIDRKGDPVGRTPKGQSTRKSRATSNEYIFDAETLVELGALAICMVAEGGAVRMGRTRDGGALSIGLYKGDETLTEYVRPNEDLHTALVEIADAWLDKGAESFIATVNALRGR